MPRHITVKAFCLCAAIAVPASAIPAAADEPINCANANSTVEINYCADKAYEAADKELNAAYAAALKVVRSRDLEKPYDAKSFEEAVRSAQRAWVAYRDAECKGVVAQVWTNGTGSASAILGCMTDKTVQRTKELKDQLQPQ